MIEFLLYLRLLPSEKSDIWSCGVILRMRLVRIHSKTGLMEKRYRQYHANDEKELFIYLEK